MSRTRKIEDLYFKTRCTECNKKIRLTFNTVKCPKCGTQFEDNEVKQFYYNCESKMVNNPLLFFLYCHPKKIWLALAIITGIIANKIR